MKETKEQALNWGALLARFAVGGVLVYAGFLKLSAPVEEFAYAIESYRLLPHDLSLLAASFMRWFELYLGVFIIFGVFARFSAFLSLAVFAAFEFFLLQAIIRGLPITNCGCFGASSSNGIYTEFFLNLVWIILSFFILKKGGSLSVDSLLDRMEENENKK